MQMQWIPAASSLGLLTALLNANAFAAQLSRLPNAPGTTNVWPKALNNAGIATGYFVVQDAGKSADSAAAVWADEQRIDVADSRGNWGVGVTEAGVVAGGVSVAEAEARGILFDAHAGSFQHVDASVPAFAAISRTGTYAVGSRKADAYMWRSVMHDGIAISDLATPEGWTVSQPIAVNDSGVVVGRGGTRGNEANYRHGGFVTRGNVSQEFNVPGYPEFIAEAVNNSNLAAGNADLFNQRGEPAISAVLDLDTNAVMPLASARAGDGTFVWGMNEQGDVVGYGLPGDYTSYPLLWRHGHYDEPIRLLSLLDGEAANSFFEPVDINERGDVLGRQRYLNPALNDMFHAAIISGVLPEPATLLAFALPLAMTRRRR